MDVKLYVVFVLACTLCRSAQGITGADLVKVEDYSYNVIVSYQKPTGPSFHSGSLVHKRFVLTTGVNYINVIWNDDKKSVKSVLLKSFHDMVVKVLIESNAVADLESKKGIIEKVKTLHLPQECLDSTQIHGSIAVLELQNDLDLSHGNIQILKLPTINLRYLQDYEKFALFTGFGSRSKIVKETGLCSMEVNTVDCPKEWLDASSWGTFCGSSIILHRNINNSQNQSLGAFYGDDGGPLVYRKNTLIGILQVDGDGDDRLGLDSPSRFTNVSHHIDFINDVIAGVPSLHITHTISHS